MNIAKKFALTVMCGFALVVALPVESHADGNPGNPSGHCYEQSPGDCVRKTQWSCNGVGMQCAMTFGVCGCVQ